MTETDRTDPEFANDLKSGKITSASDYSESYIRNIRYQKEKAEKDEAFLDFVRAYKQKLWSEK